MNFNGLRSPVTFSKTISEKIPHKKRLRGHEDWWEREGRGTSDAVDRTRTPWLRMFDASGTRVDEILFAPEYWRMLRKGYRAGVVWRAFEEDSLVPAYL